MMMQTCTCSWTTTWYAGSLEESIPTPLASYQGMQTAPPPTRTPHPPLVNRGAYNPPVVKQKSRPDADYPPMVIHRSHQAADSSVVTTARASHRGRRGLDMGEVGGGGESAR